MRVIDTEHLGRRRVIGCWEIDGVLVDPGPESTLATVLAGLEPDFAPRAILLTHIHFDHAGAAGALVKRWPEVPVYVHEVGAPHLADPAKLVKSATRLYGEEGMQRLWGAVTPVPQDNLHVLAGGETGGGAVGLLAGREAVDGRAAAYVCEGFSCRRPVTTPEELFDLLGQAH